MHRVELKVLSPTKELIDVQEKVPNAPCGVERAAFKVRAFFVFVFLMHRVELKAL
jgi:hypothetical protein